MDEEQMNQPRKPRKNPARKPGEIEAKARAAQQTLNRGANIATKSAEKSAEKAVQASGKKAAKLTAKAAQKTKMAGNLTKAAAKAGKVAQVAAKLAKIMATVGIFILIFIAIVGLLVFLLTGLGLIMAGLQKVAQAFWDFCVNLTVGQENNIHADEIRDTLSYLEEMGYDVYGYGFVTKQDAYIVKKTKEEDQYGNEYVKDKQKELNTSYFAASNDSTFKYITAYLISDNYAQTVKNSNVSFKTWFGGAGQAIKNMWSSVFGGEIKEAEFGSGLISIHHDGSKGDGGQEGIGVVGEEFSNFWEKGYVKVDNGKLKVDGGGMFNTAVFEYSLDGWTGRYSMPLEFLLSVHLATMAPDLSYELATSFDTDVEILLYKSQGGEIDAAVQENGKENTRTLRSKLTEINDSWFADGNSVTDTLDNWSLSKSETLEILQQTNIESYKKESDKYKCIGPPVWKELGSETPIINETVVGVTEEKADELKGKIIDKVNELLENNGLESYKNLIEQDVQKFLEGSTTTAMRAQKQIFAAPTETEVEITYTPLSTGIEDRKNFVTMKVEWEGFENDQISVKCFIPEYDIAKTEEVLNSELEEEVNTFIENVKEIKATTGEANYQITNAGLEDSETLKEKIKDWYEAIGARTNLNDYFGFGEALNGNHAIKVNGKISQETANQNPPDSSENNGSNQNDATQIVVKKSLTIQGEYNNSEIRGSYDGDDDARFQLKVSPLKINDTQATYTVTLLVKTNDQSEIKWCDDPNNTADEACECCAAYVSLIYKSLNEIKVSSLDAYFPYINKVKNHWYRDVYFTKAAAELAGEHNLVATDDEYEKQTGERWTLYETDDNNQYELYAYIYQNGDYKTEFTETKNGYLVCKKVEKGKGTYRLNQDGVTYEKAQADGEYKLVCKKDSKYTDYNGDVEKFRVGKKAQTKTLPDNWSAYGPSKKAGVWTTLSVNDESPKKIQTATELGLEFLYKASYDSVEQIEDGVRGQTNSKIKKLFLDDYYLYDGTGPRAALIQKAKEMAGSDDPDDFRKKHKKNEIIEVNYTPIDDEGNKQDSKEYKTTIDEISGPINITHSSLSAFSMLQNMHTLDAEYIYHDFKELIVELNYFDKEDLVEPESEVLMFPISGYAANGWPKARYDKSEDYYGTLIHSASDYNAKTEETQAEIYKNIGELVEQEFADVDTLNKGNQANPKSQNPIHSNKPTGNGSGYKGDTLIETATNCWQYIVDSGKYTYAGAAIPITGGSTVDCSSFISWILYEYGYEDFGGWQNCTGDFMTKDWNSMYGWEVIEVGPGEDCSSQIQPGDIFVRDNGGGVGACGHVQFIYSIEEDGTIITYDCGSSSHWVTANREGYISNFTRGDSKNRPGKIIRIENPSTKKELNKFEGYAGSIAATENEEAKPEYVLAPVTGEVLKYGTTERKNLETGKTDIVGYIKIRALGNKERKLVGNNAKYKFGRVEDDEKKEIYGDYLTKDDALGWLDEAYGDQAEEGEKPTKRDKVGYDYFWEEYKNAGISDNVIYIEGFDVSDILGEDIAGTPEAPPQNESKSQKSYIQKLSKYISGESATDDNPAPQNAYSTTYTVPNLLDDNREFALKIGEQAKEDAVYTFSQGSGSKQRIYIKEGAVIGKTYQDGDKRVCQNKKLTVLTEEEKQKAQEDTETLAAEVTTSKKTGNNLGTSSDNNVETEKKKFAIGNYIRVIMRDTDDQVVDHVDEYFERLEEGQEVKKSDTDVDFEFFYFLPKEGGAIDISGSGPEEVSIKSWNSNEMAAGIIQWTSLLNTGMNNIVDKLCKRAYELDSDLCKELKAFTSMNVQQIFNSEEDLQAAFTTICQRDRDAFFNLQAEIAKEGFLYFATRNR